MDRLLRVTVIVDLLDALREKGSWCGETHIQKAVYFLQELAKVPTGFAFILYKHGPFSFDLRDELTAMRADGLLEISVRPHPYGPSIVATSDGEKIRQHFSNSIKAYAKKIRLVANEIVGSRGVAELERLATALYVTGEDERAPGVKRAERVSELKPHISRDLARNAIETVDSIREIVR